MTVSSELTFYGGWVGLIAAGAGYWYLQKQRAAASRSGRGGAQRAVSERKDKQSSKKQRAVNDGASGDEKKAKKAPRKPRLAESQSTTEASYASVAGASNDHDDDIDNREFARMLSDAKAGTSFAAAPKASARQKSVKQSKANKNSVFLSNDPADTSSNNVSVPSSATGGDADDDLSATTSPELGAVPESGDIADMLEPRKTGPSVLRLTEPTQPITQKAKPAPKQPEPVETKKQRQNRKKAEAAKADREAAEQERKVLMEKQRRTARLAEGRAAKDGSAFMASRPPATSAWSGAPASTQGGEAAKSMDLLDTFEPTKNVNGNTAQTQVKESTTAKGWQEDVPSEEEQMRLLEKENEEAAWSTVTSKKSKKGDDSARPRSTKTNSYLPTPSSAATTKSNNPFDSVAVQDDEWEVA